MWNSLLGGGGDEEDEQSSQGWLMDESQDLCALSPTQRVYGFAACLLAGVVCMYMSLLVLVIPIKFALLFTFGNMLAIGSTVFLIGFGQQIRMMFDPVRAYATAIYVGFVVLALICALLIHSKLLTLIAIICEMCALICSGQKLTSKKNLRVFSDSDDHFSMRGYYIEETISESTPSTTLEYSLLYGVLRKRSLLFNKIKSVELDPVWGLRFYSQLRIERLKLGLHVKLLTVSLLP